MKRLLNTLAIASLLTIGVAPLTAAPAQAVVTTTVVNSDSAGGQVSRFDVDGNSLDAHDGSMLRVGNLYYLYGTSYTCGYRYNFNHDFCGFKVYSTPDFVNWTDHGYAVPPQQCRYCFRPHAVYNAATGKYVLWADNNVDGRYKVYTSPSPTGPFTLQPAPTPNLVLWGDFKIFTDDNGAAYLIGATGPHNLGIERLTDDYLNVTSQNTTVTMGDIEGFTAFKRNGKYHIVLGDPRCPYCGGTPTTAINATNMMGPWSGIWYDPNPIGPFGEQAPPRYRGTVVNANSCSGQPLDTIPVPQADGSTQYLFISDRWDAPGNHIPGVVNESLANFFFGPITFAGDGTIQTINCVNSFSMTLPGNAGSQNTTPTRDQSSGVTGFRHHCDVVNGKQRQQSFTPSRTSTLNTASITTFRRDTNAPLVIELVNSASNTVMYSKTFDIQSVPWAPHVMTIHPNVGVVAGQSYALRLRSTTTAGCYGVEYNPFNPYGGGIASVSNNSGASFDAEAWQDLKFTADVGYTTILAPNALPAGYTLCAVEGQTCTVPGTRTVAYGAGSYLFKTITTSTTCGVSAFGGDPTPGILKACYLAPAGGPAGYSAACAGEYGTCTFTGPRMVAYGANGSFVYDLAKDSKVCSYLAFGEDPIYGVSKSCYLASTGTPPGGWTSCATESSTCTTAGNQTIAFGANGSFIVKDSGTTGCTAPAFGYDPAPGVVKACYLRTGPPAGYGTTCAAEGATCARTGLFTVAYGARGKFIYKSFTGNVPCTNTSFGGDPNDGVAKTCYVIA